MKSRSLSLLLHLWVHFFLCMQDLFYFKIINFVIQICFSHFHNFFVSMDLLGFTTLPLFAVRGVLLQLDVMDVIVVQLWRWPEVAKPAPVLLTGTRWWWRSALLRCQSNQSHMKEDCCNFTSSKTSLSRSFAKLWWNWSKNVTYDLWFQNDGINTQLSQVGWEKLHTRFHFGNIGCNNYMLM